MAGKFDLGMIFKILANPNVRWDEIAIEQLVSRLKPDNTTELMINLIQAGATGLRYGLEKDKGNKRFAEQMVNLIFAQQIEKHKAELKRQNKQERKELAKLRYYLPENIEKRHQRQIERAHKQIEALQGEREDKLRELHEKLSQINDEAVVNPSLETMGKVAPDSAPHTPIRDFTSEVSELETQARELEEQIKDAQDDIARAPQKVQPQAQPTKANTSNQPKSPIPPKAPIADSINDTSSPNALAQRTALLDYAQEGFTLKEKERVLNAKNPVDEAQAIVNRKYRKILKKVKETHQKLREEVSNISVKKVDYRGINEGRFNTEEKKNFELRGLALIDEEDFDNLSPREQVKQLEHLQWIWERSFKTKGKRRKFVRENIKVKQEYEPAWLDLDEDDINPWTMVAMAYVDSLNGNTGGLLNGIIGDDREELIQNLRKQYGFTKKQLTSTDYYDYPDFSEFKTETEAPKGLVQNVVNKPFKFVGGSTSYLGSPNKWERRAYDYGRTSGEVQEILADEGKTRQEKLKELSSKSTEVKGDKGKRGQQAEKRKQRNEVEVVAGSTPISAVGGENTNAGQESISPSQSRRENLLKKIREIENVDLEARRKHLIANAERRRTETFAKSNAIDAVQRFDTLKAERLARQMKDRRRQLAIRLATIGLQPKKASSVKQAVQYGGLRTYKRMKKKK